MWSQTRFISSTFQSFFYGGLHVIAVKNEIHILTFRPKQDRTCTMVYIRVQKKKRCGRCK